MNTWDEPVSQHPVHLQHRVGERMKLWRRLCRSVAPAFEGQPGIRLLSPYPLLGEAVLADCRVCGIQLLAQPVTAVLLRYHRSGAGAQERVEHQAGHALSTTLTGR